MEKAKHDFNKDLEDMKTSPATLRKAISIEECHVVGNDVLPTDLAFSLYNQRHVQSSENRASTHCNVLFSRMDGVHVKVHASIPSGDCIKMHDPPLIGLQEVATHSVALALIQQFKFPASTPARTMCNQLP